ncbi:hypothetical protein G6O46_24130, partial [Salmonella enterica subsp. enterica serovar Enteritidis]|uniref:hypothetical protein n=1 Tax=Salmonella enterica TaxID=28901 RepID=UPI0018C8BFAB
RYAKDNRLVPHGFDRKSAFSAYIAPIGVEQDPGFGDADVVTYRLGDVPAGATITVELLFQVARPSDIEAFAGAPTPAARRL